VLSVASLAILRGACNPDSDSPVVTVDSLVGVVAMVQERMARRHWRVEVRGSMWAARNTSDVTLDPGSARASPRRRTDARGCPE
jgi:membrane protein implicated in regulation of membrane protease activity